MNRFDTHVFFRLNMIEGRVLRERSLWGQRCLELMVVLE